MNSISEREGVVFSSVQRRGPPQKGTKKPPTKEPSGANYLSIRCRPQLSDLNINCVHSFFTTFSVESDLVAFANVVDQTCYVNKNFFLGRVVYYEAKSFRFVEELYGTLIHAKKIIM